MIAITSISPKHSSDQKSCIKTWIDNDLKVVSFNAKDEIYNISKLYPEVKFIEGTSLKKIYGRDFIALNDIFKFINESNENCMVINSDIELIKDDLMLRRINPVMENSIVLANRLNYINDKEKSKLHSTGFDLFFVHKKFIDLFKETNFALGQCHFDYWIPYVAIKNNIPVNIIKNKFAFHKHHRSLHYANGNWQITGKHLIEVESLPFKTTMNGIWKANDYVFDIINQKSEHIEI